MEFKAEHLFYFDSRDARVAARRARASSRCGSIEGARRSAPATSSRTSSGFPVPVVSPLGELAEGDAAERAAAPQSVTVVASGIDVLAHKPPTGPVDRRRPKLSVIMPVFNERNTFADVVDAADGEGDSRRRHGDRRSSRATPPTARATRSASSRAVRGVKVIYEERAARQGARRARRAGARDRRLHPDSGRRPRVRPQRLRDPARAAARGHAPRSSSARGTDGRQDAGRCATSPIRCSSAR